MSTPSEVAAYVEKSVVQLIVFHLGEEDFAIPIEDVREIIRGAPVTPVPGAAAGVEGVINVRGDIAAAIDLRVRFGLPPRKESKPKHIVITAHGKNLFALVVDEVVEVLRLSKDEIKPPPDIASRRERDCVTGVVARAGRLIVLLDLAKALADETPLTERQRPAGPEQRS